MKWLWILFGLLVVLSLGAQSSYTERMEAAELILEQAQELYETGAYERCRIFLDTTIDQFD
jgi:hypothetical protein